MFGLCKFKDILGKPGDGFHAPRCFGMACNDLLGSLALSVVISVVTDYPLWKTILCVGLGVIVIHRAFCVDTAINVQIFGTLNP